MALAWTPAGQAAPWPPDASGQGEQDWRAPAVDSLLRDLVGLGYYRGFVRRADTIEASHPECAALSASCRPRRANSASKRCRRARTAQRRPWEKPLAPQPPESPPDDTVVLIVDDMPDNIAPLHDALDDAGYTVLVALDGEAALARAPGAARRDPARRRDARPRRFRGRAPAQGRPSSRISRSCS